MPLKSVLSHKPYTNGTYSFGPFDVVPGKVKFELPRVTWPVGHPLVFRLFHVGEPKEFLKWEPDGGVVLHKGPQGDPVLRELERDWLTYRVNAPGQIEGTLEIRTPLTTGIEWRQE